MNTLVTGITGGLGTALKEALEKKGFKVFGQTCHKKSNITIDFANPYHMSKMESFMFANNIRCLINNAAVYSDAPLVSMPDSAVIDMVNVNLVAPILLSKYLYRHLKITKESGLIVNINSIAGKQPTFPESIYSATKHGLGAFGTALSMHQRDSKVSIIDCYFGGIKSNITKGRNNYDSLIEPKEAAEFVVNSMTSGIVGSVSSFEYRRK